MKNSLVVVRFASGMCTYPRSWYWNELSDLYLHQREREREKLLSFIAFSLNL